MLAGQGAAPGFAGSGGRAFQAAVPPGATDDITKGYGHGDTWVDTVLDVAHICVDNTVGAAVWQAVGGGGGSVIIVTEKDTTGGAQSHALPLLSTVTEGVQYIVKDSGDKAFTNNITVSTANIAVDFFDGAATSFVIANNSGSVTFMKSPGTPTIWRVVAIV